MSVVEDFQAAQGMPVYSGVGGAEAGGSSFDLRSMLGVLLRRWKLVLSIPLAVVILTAVGLSVIAPKYRSTVEILAADPKRQTNIADERRLSTLDVDAAAMASEVAVISSKSVALRAAKELGLDKDPEFQPKPSLISELLERLGFEQEKPMPVSGPVGETVALDRAAGELQLHTSVERVFLSYVLSVSVTSTDAAKAQRLAAAIANAYTEDQRESQQQAVKRATDWLTGRIDEMRSRVIETETQIEKLRSQSGLIDIGGAGGANLSQQQTADLNNQLVIARADVAEKKARYEQAQRVVISSNGDIQAIPEVVASPVIGQLRGQQADVSRREAELASHFGERYPDLVNVRSQLKDINKAIDGEVARILANMRNSYEVSQQREQSIEKSLGNLTEDRSKSTAAVKLQELQRVDDADRRLYQTFLSSFNDVSQRATLSEVTARIITPATLPIAPSSPRKNLILAFSSALGTFVGVVLAFLVEALDSTFKTSIQVEQVLGVPVLGAKFEVRGRRGLPWRRGRNSKDAIAGMIANPISRLSEAIRAVRVSLMRDDEGETPKTVLVTSSLPGEGKTTASVLLAASCRTAGQRALLIDCDLRRRAATRYFGLEGKPGLAEILDKGFDLSDAVQHDDRTGLAILPAGMGAQSPADLLNSWEMRELLRELRDRYDCIVLDAAAVLAVVESAILATMVDRILFIVQWNRTPRASAVEAFRSLGPEARNIAGVMLSRVNQKRMQSYGYGYGYGSSRYYGEMDKYYG